MPEPTDVVRRVREAVATSLREGEPTLQVVAANQNTSVRTLQRRLAEEGVTFRSVVDEVRQELAQGMLADGRLTIAEMAYLLGYSEPSAFHRAYKRWTGKTPEEYRRSHR
jgi:AraC-like DNA-binding protein